MGGADTNSLSKHLHPDKLQIFLLGLCAFDLIFFCYYLFEYELETESTISDSLFTRPEYAAVLCVTLAVRLTGVVLFFIRYRYLNPVGVGIGCICVCLTLFGWAWLVQHRENQQHFTGVFLFCLGSFGYSIVLLRLCQESHPHLFNLHFRLELFLFITTALLVIAFVVLWVMEETDNKHQKGMEGLTYTDQTQKAYIVEHCAYIASLLFYAGFFLFHTPDPLRLPDVEAVYDAERYNNNGAEMMMFVTSPLLERPAFTTMAV